MLIYYANYVNFSLAFGNCPLSLFQPRHHAHQYSFHCLAFLYHYVLPYLNGNLIVQIKYITFDKTGPQ